MYSVNTYSQHKERKYCLFFMLKYIRFTPYLKFLSWKKITEVTHYLNTVRLITSSFLQNLEYLLPYPSVCICR